MYYVYILLNKKGNRTYIGCTKHVNKRIEEHNAGLVKSSRTYRPYFLVYLETFSNIKEARKKERYYKNPSGRRKMKKMFFEKTWSKAIFEKE